MTYDEFFERFGGSLRVKNLIGSDETESGPARGKPRFDLPQDSELPPVFVRLDPWEAEYVYRVAERRKLGIVETGRWCGGSTFLFSCAAPDLPIHSIDIDPQDDDGLRQHFQRLQIGEHVNLIVGDSQNSKYESIGEFDLLFVDGDHTYEGCLKDLENWFPDLAPGGHVLLHDMYPLWGCMDAAIDFIDRHRDQIDVRIDPLRVSEHWTHPAGSIGHFVKRG